MNERLQHAAQFKEKLFPRDKNLRACGGDPVERRQLKLSKIPAFGRKPPRRNKETARNAFRAV
jgi:hypothetical protein